MGFMRDITYRDGIGSSKKCWFNLACLTATGILILVTYKDTLEDYALIAMYSVYLVTVGGFEVIPKMLAMLIEFKNGSKGANPPA